MENVVEIKKIEKTDLDEINNLRDDYQNVTYAIGQLNVEKKLIQEQLNKLDQEVQNQYTEYEKLRTREEEFAANLETKYGKGELNLQTGEFTPINA
jgi:predicted nuclease with TOPRIM domain